jgi:hypothetical protein
LHPICVLLPAVAAAAAAAAAVLDCGHGFYVLLELAQLQVVVGLLCGFESGWERHSVPSHLMEEIAQERSACHPRNRGQY